jgi:hypothetical protein
MLSLSSVQQRTKDSRLGPLAQSAVFFENAIYTNAQLPWMKTLWTARQES